jgi:hypothetical protein
MPLPLNANLFLSSKQNKIAEIHHDWRVESDLFIPCSSGAGGVGLIPARPTPMHKTCLFAAVGDLK